MSSFSCGIWCQPVSSQLAPISLSFEVYLKLGCQLLPQCPRLLVCFSICQSKCPWVVNNMPSSSASQLGVCEEETLHLCTQLWGSKPSCGHVPWSWRWKLTEPPSVSGRGFTCYFGYFLPSSNISGKRSSGRRRKNFHSHSETIADNILV